MIVVDCEQGSDEWARMRAGIVTASCYADMQAKGRGNEESVKRRDLRLRLALERITGRAAEGFTTWAMKQGTEREPLARDAYEVHTRNLVEQVGFCRHEELETGASPDGLIGDEGGLEIKCPVPATHLETLRSKRVPPEYVLQVQGNLWITGRKWWDFVSWNPDFPEGLQLFVTRVQRDEFVIKALELSVAFFMDEVRRLETEIRDMA